MGARTLRVGGERAPGAELLVNGGAGPGAQHVAAGSSPPSHVLSALERAAEDGALAAALRAGDGLAVVRCGRGGGAAADAHEAGSHAAARAVVRACEALGRVEVEPVDCAFERAVEGVPELHEFSLAPSARAPRCSTGNVAFDPRDGTPAWHTDQSFRSDAPALSALYCVLAPTVGGETLFAGTAEALAALPAERRRGLAATHVTHSLEPLARQLRQWGGDVAQGRQHERAPAPRRLAVTRPLVREDGYAGRPALYLNPLATVDDAEGAREGEGASGRALAFELAAHATRAEFVTVHKWEPGDLVVWDNRCTMHAATSFVGERLMWRATIAVQ